ncbi:hypothetical protein BKA69DRAFT_1054403 [Paraphysoderma sedebokerense]|nr:hypothetical protein BKA69DRAFT_1054403 [Paraphysoderma sedebokerense]
MIGGRISTVYLLGIGWQSVASCIIYSGVDSRCAREVHVVPVPLPKVEKLSSDYSIIIHIRSPPRSTPRSGTKSIHFLSFLFFPLFFLWSHRSCMIIMRLSKKKI